MKTVNWGIVGCGNVCERKSGPAMYKTPHSALAAVMRRDAEKAADFARRHNVPKSYTDAAALIADPEVDIVYVATPPGTHRELAVQALEAGKPVYVEKPMAMNHAECLEMIAAAEKAGQKLFVAYYRRALPYFLKVKELLDGGSVGQPLSGGSPPVPPGETRRPRSGPSSVAAAPGGRRRRLFPRHRTAHARHPRFPARGDRRRPGLQEQPRGILRRGGHRRGVVLLSLGRPRYGNVVLRRSALRCGGFGRRHGPQGLIRFSTFMFSADRTDDGRGSERFEIDPPEHIQGPLIETIVRELRGEGVCPSTGVSAARTSRVMDEIMKE